MYLHIYYHLLLICIFALYNKTSHHGEATIFVVHSWILYQIAINKKKNVMIHRLSLCAVVYTSECFPAHWIKPLQHQHEVPQLAEQRERTERLRERGSGGGRERWKPTLEELNYRSLFSLSFSRLLWPTSKRWCSHDPTQYTDILFNPASMKFLQIKPLCWATANYLTDWPPSGSGYSVEWPCFSPPTHTTSTHPLSPSPSAKRGHFEKIPEGLILFRRLYISTPPFLFPTIYPSKIRGAWCVCVCVCVCTGGSVCQWQQSFHSLKGVLKQKYLIFPLK